MNKRVIIIGVLLSTIFFSIILLNIKGEQTVEKDIYFLQLGVYKNKNNVSKVTKSLTNYLVIEEDKKYYIFVGITSIEENANKIKEIYNKMDNNIYIKTRSVYNQSFIKSLEKYDELLINTKSKDAIMIINNEILKKYKEVINGKNK